MLIACSECHRQYDVGTLKEGSRVRCHCGHVCYVPEPQSRPVELLHCSSCGGSVSDSTNSTCSYCQSELSLGERGLGISCPECFARLAKNAQFCSTCGVEVTPEIVATAVTASDCPRCQEKLVLREGSNTAFAECAGCGGVWLDESTFSDAMRNRHRSAIARAVSHRAVSGGSGDHETDVRYLPCATCGELMNRKNFGGTSGIVIDWCRGHGYWFDTDELTRIIDFIEQQAANAHGAAPIAPPHAEPRKPSERSTPTMTLPPQEFGSMGSRGGFGDVLIDVISDVVWKFFRH